MSDFGCSFVRQNPQTGKYDLFLWDQNSGQYLLHDSYQFIQNAHTVQVIRCRALHFSEQFEQSEQ